MTDPLSTTASIIAVVQLSSVIVKYINAAAGAAKERKLLRDGVRACEFVLQQLKDDADDNEEGDSWSETIKVLEGPDGPLCRLSVALNLVKLKLEPREGFEKIVASMKWPFSEKEVQSILATIEREKSLLQLAMMNDSRKILGEVKRLAGENKTQLENLISSIERSSSEQTGNISRLIADTTVAVEGNQEKLANIQAGVEEIIDYEAMKERQRILDWLTPSDYAQQQVDFYSRRQEGTGERLLESAEFQAWLNTKQKTLFCPGIPGAGKTMQMSIVIDYLSQRFKDSSDTGLAYVYCNFRRQAEQTAQDLCTKLLRQLAQSQPFLPQSLLSLHKIHSESQTRPSTEEISKVLQSVASTFPRVFIFVDALDECRATHECRINFLANLFQVQAESGTNILVTSRPILDIQAQFKDCPSLEILASDEDIRKYVAGNMSQLVPFVSDKPKLQTEIQSAIADAVEGMFLLAQLYLGSLDDKTSPREIRNALEHFKKEPSGSSEGRKLELLSKAYDEAMHRVNGQKEGFQTLARKVLAWITCARRPLTTSELQHALAVEVGDNELDEENIHRIEDMVSVCAGLVTIDEESDIVRLVHYSTQEYFERTQQRWFPGSETKITDICITYLSFDVFGSGPQQIMNDYSWRDANYPLYRYTAENWVHHASNCSVLSNEIFDFMESGAKWKAAILGLDRVMPGNSKGLHVAALYDARKIAEALLVRGKELEPRDHRGGTPLHVAAEEGSESVIKLLLDRGAHINTRDMLRYTPLARACISPRLGETGIIKLLLEQGADIDARDSKKSTPLMQACQRGAKDIVGILLEEGADIKTYDAYRRTSLHKACLGGHVEVVQLLLDNGADINALDEMGQSPLFLAFGSTRTESITELLLANNADINVCDIVQTTPFHVACQYDVTVQAVQMLLDYGADINKRDKWGQTPIHIACGNQDEEVIQHLINNGADVNVSDNEGETPLHKACQTGGEKVVEMLLENSPTTNAYNGIGQTPFHIACLGRSQEVIQLFLNNNADTTLCTEKGETPLHIACQEASLDVIQLLLDNRAGEQLCDNQGRTALHVACQRQDVDVIQLLLDRGFDPKVRDIEGQTPFHIACQSQTEDVVELLLSNGADLTIRDVWGRTPFRIASQSRGQTKEVVQLLLDNGADIKTCDDEGQTALHIACQTGRKGIIRLLLENGADITTCDSNGKTPLDMAHQNKKMGIAQILLDHSVSIAK